MSDNILPQTEHPKLIVVEAFDRGENSELFPAVSVGHEAEETWGGLELVENEGHCAAVAVWA